MKHRKDNVIARRADESDAAVGQRVRARRLEQRFSQTELADRIGVTFQQVQKYEKGTNRIGAGRLSKIAEALAVPVSFFFDQAKGEKADTVFAHLQSAGAVHLVQAFDRIKSPKSRALLVKMAENLASPA